MQNPYKELFGYDRGYTIGMHGGGHLLREIAADQGRGVNATTEIEMNEPHSSKLRQWSMQYDVTTCQQTVNVNV